jgi:hypothetical protein
MPYRRIWIVAPIFAVLLAPAARAQQTEPAAPPMSHEMHHAVPHATPAGSHRMPPTAAASADVASPEAIVAAFYESIATPAGSHRMPPTAAAPADVASPEAIVAAFYESISGPAGKPRDRGRYVSLFFPGARLLPAEGKGHSGTMPMQFSPGNYLADTQGNMLEDGFIEKQIARRSESFGKLVHVWSTYEVRHAEADAKPFVRGVNSFQLFNDGKRWWIFSLVWQPETAKLTLPDELLH